MTTLDEWSALAARTLAVESPDRAAQGLVLDVAREVAHNVVRPAAPLSTFLLGLAVGRGMPVDEAAAMLIELARRSADQGSSAGEGRSADPGEADPPS
jgi:hypothetical protein